MDDDPAPPTVIEEADALTADLMAVRVELQQERLAAAQLAWRAVQQGLAQKYRLGPGDRVNLTTRQIERAPVLPPEPPPLAPDVQEPQP